MAHLPGAGEIDASQCSFLSISERFGFIDLLSSGCFLWAAA
jgi:hypothetical protein